jgi:hypothetical protein
MDERQAERVESILVSQDQVIFDLSTTGARIRIPQKIIPGTLVQLHLSSKTGLNLTLKGEVKRISELNSMILVGLHFLNLGPADQATLNTLVEHFGKGVPVSAQIVG